MVASALSFIPPEYHADILAGTSTVDVAPYLNAGLASARIFELPQSGQMSVASTLNIPSGGGILGVNFGCTIKVLPDFGNHPIIRNARTAPAHDAERDRDIVLTGLRLDGNKASNSTASEFGHGITLNAVNGCRLDVQVVNPKGDGLSLQQSGTIDTPNWRNWIGCSNISGKVRTFGCRRQGVAIVCGEQIDLDVYDYGGTLMSVDIEPDDPENFVRNVILRVLSIGTGDGTETSGGVCISDGATGTPPTNVMIDFLIYNSGGQGIIWRGCKGLILQGTIVSPARNGLVGHGSGGVTSTVTFKTVRVLAPGGQGLVAREIPGSVYDGTLYVEDGVSGGAQIENAAGGVLSITALRSGQHGLLLSNTENMTFHPLIVEDSGSHNVWLKDGSSGNRFPFLKAVRSKFGAGFVEDLGCNNNRASFARVAGNGNGNVLLNGAQSAVALEP